MTSLMGDMLRSQVAVVLAVAVFALGARPARAVDADNPATPPQITDADKPPGSSKPETDQPAAAAPAVPQLQLQDEGPSVRNSDSGRLSRSRMAALDDSEERPFWKHWLFWTVTGAVVVGAVSMAIYMSSGTESSLAPCPPDIFVSLGCWGAGRGQ